MLRRVLPFEYKTYFLTGAFNIHTMIPTCKKNGIHPSGGPHTFTWCPPGSRDPPAVDGGMSHSFVHSLHDGKPSLALTGPGKGLR